MSETAGGEVGREEEGVEADLGLSISWLELWLEDGGVVFVVVCSVVYGVGGS